MRHVAHIGHPHETGRERTAVETETTRGEGTVAAETGAANEAIAKGTVLATDGTGTETGIADVTEISTEVIVVVTAIATANAMKETRTAAANGLKMTTSPTEGLMTVQKGSARTMEKTFLPLPMELLRRLPLMIAPGVRTAEMVTETLAMAMTIHLDTASVKGGIAAAVTSTTKTGVVKLGVLYLPESSSSPIFLPAACFLIS